MKKFNFELKLNFLPSLNGILFRFDNWLLTYKFLNKSTMWLMKSMLLNVIENLPAVNVFVSIE